MLRRLLIGLGKGFVLGAVVGAVLHFGFGFTRGGLLLGYLVAMGSASTAGILAGKPPWQHDAGTEVVLKAAVGLGIGALVYFLSARYAAWTLPFTPPTFPANAKWVDVPLLVAIVSSTFYGMLVELDNTGNDAKPQPPAAKNARTRHEIEEAEIVSPAKRGL